VRPFKDIEVWWQIQQLFLELQQLSLFGHYSKKIEKIPRKNRILLYSWLLTGSHHQNLATWKLFSSKSGEFWAICISVQVNYTCNANGTTPA
jgi:hypothetical protein